MPAIIASRDYVCITFKEKKQGALLFFSLSLMVMEVVSVHTCLII